ncbi:VOC family protein [Brevundimonas sp. 2R-24]|uniref:VOC family protein n=1 Tax=Peiella sedimenti TaxID=3061083 RepID=A0ABT8SKV9_9CAUL|nr:VOC family protein [Caulobacteraceae bacterium XZ-24]
MLDHIGFNCSDVKASRAFYEAALKPLGVGLIMEVGPDQTGGPTYLGYGKDGKPFFWFGDDPQLGNKLHVAFTAETRDQVDAFYRAAMAAGGTDNGPPGVRAIYHPNYYGAFVLDPDGHNIEAVCHKPGDAADQKTPGV